MADEITWEYRVQTFGSALRSPKDDDLEAALDEWGAEGWEVVAAVAPDNSNKIRVFAKRPLLSRPSRRASWPG
jgi:hypothetical protein